MSAQQPKRRPRPRVYSAPPRESQFTARRCSSCSQIAELTKRLSRVHGCLWLCKRCETTADERGWLE